MISGYTYSQKTSGNPRARRARQDYVRTRNADSAQTIPIGFVWRNVYCSKDQGIALR